MQNHFTGPGVFPHKGQLYVRTDAGQSLPALDYCLAQTKKAFFSHKGSGPATLIIGLRSKPGYILSRPLNERAETLWAEAQKLVTKTPEDWFKTKYVPALINQGLPTWGGALKSSENLTATERKLLSSAGTIWVDALSMLTSARLSPQSTGLVQSASTEIRIYSFG